MPTNRDIKWLRTLENFLEEMIAFCPPDDAPERLFEMAEARAEGAQERFDMLEPVFALLDAVEDLAARLERLERLTGYYAEEVKE